MHVSVTVTVAARGHDGEPKLLLISSSVRNHARLLFRTNHSNA